MEKKENNLVEVVQEVAKDIIGTCCRLEEVLNDCEYDMDLVYNETFMEMLKQECFYCYECGFWCDASDMRDTDDRQMCEECFEYSYKEREEDD